MARLTDQQRVELEALEAMPDDQIDYSDIPEMSEAEWSNAKRGLFYKPDWQRITLRLDQNVVDWFEENAKDHEEAHKNINQALMDHMRREMFPARNRPRKLPPTRQEEMDQ